ncbi:MAG: hypothetical protein IPM79_13470 [Polyangiaceae bacterium]|nr:hypothetical protein [Polyangiaceae bacterium]
MSAEVRAEPFPKRESRPPTSPSPMSGMASFPSARHFFPAASDTVPAATSSMKTLPTIRSPSTKDDSVVRTASAFPSSSTSGSTGMGKKN